MNLVSLIGFNYTTGLDECLPGTKATPETIPLFEQDQQYS